MNGQQWMHVNLPAKTNYNIQRLVAAASAWREKQDIEEMKKNSPTPASPNIREVREVFGEGEKLETTA